ncbi:MAG: DJ-1/PfpI family protein [Clostridiales bacterium]|jgi:4-methyl-5(b-hydroxyethyl)-thiazole monophosphate biosynthesis|nr:DJ-1/PfpI family protein [Clostridiales bacterium]
MAKVAVFIADGSEEVEAITPVDLLRRAKIDCDVVSVMEGNTVTASRGIVITADKNIKDIDFADYDMLVLPGGIKGTENLGSTKALTDAVTEFAGSGKGIAAICAAPTIFSGLGLLAGKEATCNPGFFDVLEKEGAQVDKNAPVVRSGNIITSQAMGTSHDFGLEIVKYFAGEEAASTLKSNIRF